MIVASLNLSLNDRTWPRRWTVVPTTVRHWVCYNTPLFVLSMNPPTDTWDHRSHDGPSYTSVLIVRDSISKDLQFFLSVRWRTSTTDRHYHDCPSYTILMTVRDLFPNGLYFFLSVHWWTSTTERHILNGPSCTTSWRLEILVLRVSIFF